MVYEDALTILSYASPYPVHLQLKRASSKTPSEGGADEGSDEGQSKSNLHHPLFRSQSMDDVNDIGKEHYFNVRRARSEMKRGSSKKTSESENLEEGRLRKWGDIGNTSTMTPMEPAEVDMDSMTNNSNFTIPDLKINTSDLMADFDEKMTTQVTVHQIGKDGEEEVDGMHDKKDDDDDDADDDSVARGLIFHRSLTPPDIITEPPISDDEMDEKVIDVKVLPDLESEVKLESSTLVSREAPSITFTKHDEFDDNIELPDSSTKDWKVGFHKDTPPEVPPVVATAVPSVDIHREEIVHESNVNLVLINDSRIGDGKEPSPKPLPRHKHQQRTTSTSSTSSVSSNSSGFSAGKIPSIMLQNSEFEHTEQKIELHASELRFETAPEIAQEVEITTERDSFDDDDEDGVVLNLGRGTPGIKFKEPEEQKDPMELELESIAYSLKMRMGAPIDLKVDSSSDEEADRTNASMAVNYNQESMLMRDDSSVPVESVEDGEEGTLALEIEDESVRAVLRDYLSDQPSLLERLGLGADGKPMEKNESEEPLQSSRSYHQTVEITSQTSGGHTTTTRTETITNNGEKVVQTSSLLSEVGKGVELPELSVLNGKALSDAKRDIRRRDSDSSIEGEKLHRSSSFSSSRSSSPVEKQVQQVQEIVLAKAEQPEEEKKVKVTPSPEINRRSGGGLSFDITSSQFQDMPSEVYEDPRGEPKGGIAYYVSVDDQLHSKSTIDMEDDDLPQPSLVRAWMGETTAIIDERTEYNHVEDDINQSPIDPREGTADDEGIKDSNFNVMINSNIKGKSETHSLSSMSPLIKSKRDIEPSHITVTQHQEIRGAYTVTVNPQGNNQMDDTDA